MSALYLEASRILVVITLISAVLVPPNICFPPNDSTGMKNFVYRKHLDAIRGVACMAVVLFHSGLDCMSNGYVGVDIFFVLSGFLICSILLRETTQTGWQNQQKCEQNYFKCQTTISPERSILVYLTFGSLLFFTRIKIKYYLTIVFYFYPSRDPAHKPLKRASFRRWHSKPLKLMKTIGNTLKIAQILPKNTLTAHTAQIFSSFLKL